MRITITTSTGKDITAVVNGSRATLGRSIKSDMPVQDDAISRFHCTFELLDGNFFVTDMNSANGVTINGERIPKNTQTIFSSFHQLQIAGLDCIVEDTEIPANSDEPTAMTTIRPATNRSPPRPTKNTPVKPKSDISKNARMLFWPLAFGAMVFFFLKTKPEVPISSDISVQPEANTPSYKKDLVQEKLPLDEFLLDSEYQGMFDKKGCINYQEICEKMKLNLEAFEGIGSYNEKEAIVFINPELRKTESKYNLLLNAGDLGELITMETVLSSDLFNMYLFKKISQIHVLMVDPKGIIIKAFRFHPKKFVPGETPRIELLSDLAASYASGSTEKFWKNISPFISKKSFEN
jgi:hypothetical protein